MTLLRRVMGETLRGQRLRQRRTLREVSGAARVSLGYLSEVERGQKEASSELLASICGALDVRMSELLREVSDTMRRAERSADVARVPARPLVPAAVRGGEGTSSARSTDASPVDSAGSGADELAALPVPVPAGADGSEMSAARPPERRRDDVERDRVPVRLDDPGRAGPGADLDDVREPDGDQIDLSELASRDGLGEVEALLRLSELVGRPGGRPVTAAARLAGAVAAA